VVQFFVIVGIVILLSYVPHCFHTDVRHNEIVLWWRDAKIVDNLDASWFIIIFFEVGNNLDISLVSPLWIEAKFKSEEEHS